MIICGKCLKEAINSDEDGNCIHCHADNFIETRDLFDKQLGLGYVTGLIKDRKNALDVIRKLLKDQSKESLIYLEQGENPKVTMKDVYERFLFRNLLNTLEEVPNFIERFDETSEEELLVANNLRSIIELFKEI